MLLAWDLATKKIYETGIDRVVLFVMDSALGTYPTGVVWNGVTGITEKPTGAEASPQYADNMKYLSLTSVEQLEGTLEAFYSPKEFDQCDGTLSPLTGLNFGQQSRKTFGLCYRTVLGNDALGNDYGYKLHFLYGLTAKPTERGYKTINDSPEANALSWDFTSVPVVAGGIYKPVSLAVVDSTLVAGAKLTALETIIYGTTPATTARMPLPAELITLLT
jgi:hypothetical protein